MALVNIEVQGRTEVEWTARTRVDVPDSVLAQDDPDTLSDWVEVNVAINSLPKDSTVNSELLIIQGVDTVD